MSISTQARIAKKLGISQSTVSRALSDNGPVNHKTKERILNEAGKLAYMINPHGRALRTGQKNNQLCFAIQDYRQLGSSYNNQRRLIGLSSEAERLGYSLTVRSFRDLNGNSESFSEIIRREGFAGVFIANDDVEPNDKRIELLKKMKVPFVLLSGHLDNADVCSVEHDLTGGTTKITAHLLDHGHKRIAFLHHKPDSRYHHLRYLGYEKALIEAGIGIDPRLVVELYQSDTDLDWWCCSRGMIRQLFSDRCDFDSIVCVTDDTALGAIDALIDEGFRIPDDIAIVGCDDIPQARRSRPRLTTVKLNTFEMGEYAVRMLDERLRNPNALSHQVRLSTELVIRQSCGCDRKEESD